MHAVSLIGNSLFFAVGIFQVPFDLLGTNTSQIVTSDVPWTF